MEETRKLIAIQSMKKNKDVIRKVPSLVPSLMPSPPVDLIGSKVVRGPAWKWGKQDGEPNNRN
jgi:hypothetical protein